MSETAMMVARVMEGAEAAAVASVACQLQQQQQHQQQVTRLCLAKKQQQQQQQQRVGLLHSRRSHSSVLCSSSSSSKANNPVDHGDYLLAHVVEAVSMLPLHGRLFMTLANGREVEVDHINPSKGRLLYRTRNPAIFLKVVHDSDVLLPIIVGETAVNMLMKAIHNEEKMGRPNHYQLLKNVVSAVDYEARMVRITERVKDTYYARIYFGQKGSNELPNVDARPSDAINFAVRCKIPIFVNRDIVECDAVRPVYTSAENWDTGKASKSAYLDRANDGPDPIAEEITLLRNMLLAVIEERYGDAARWRDQLNKLRASLKGQSF